MKKQRLSLVLALGVILLGSLTVLFPMKPVPSTAAHVEKTESEPTTVPESMDVDTVDIAAQRELGIQFSAAAFNREVVTELPISIGYMENEGITLVDLVRELPKPQTVPTEIDWSRVGQIAGVGDWRLIEAGYRLGNIPRNFEGMPTQEGQKGKLFPWTTIVAISDPETNTDEWPGDIDIRQSGPWGSNNGYDLADAAFPLTQEERDAGIQISAMAVACRKGLEAIAASPDVQAKWPGITAREIKTSTHCAVGKTQVLAVHFAPGELLDGMQNKDLWTNKDAIIEATIVHLVSKKSPRCGNQSWFWTEDLSTALCSYNPNSWGREEHQWYWDEIASTSANIDAAVTQVVHEMEEAAREAERRRGDPNKRIGPPCKSCSAGLAFGVYPNVDWAIKLGINGMLHTGTDFGGRLESIAVFEGEVIRAEYTWSAGYVVTIRSTQDPSWTADYFHLDQNSPHVEHGQIVGMGDLIGTSNGSGYYSTGAHLHFQLKRNGNFLDPMQFIEW